MVPLLVPLFVSAFRRADELAMAMEARCYHGGRHRTRMKVLHVGRRGRLGLLRHGRDPACSSRWSARCCEPADCCCA